MSFSATKTMVCVTLCASLLTLSVVPVVAAGFQITIDVAPNTLNLQNQGTVVTVHTDIPYQLVSGADVSLNGQPIAWWKSDSRGYFVAKFGMSEIKSLEFTIGGYNTLRLEGKTRSGDDFWGEQAIMVVDNGPGT